MCPFNSVTQLGVVSYIDGGSCREGCWFGGTRTRSGAVGVVFDIACASDTPGEIFLSVFSILSVNCTVGACLSPLVLLIMYFMYGHPW